MNAGMYEKAADVRFLSLWMLLQMIVSVPGTAQVVAAQTGALESYRIIRQDEESLAISARGFEDSHEVNWITSTPSRPIWLLGSSEASFLLLTSSAGTQLLDAATGSVLQLDSSAPFDAVSMTEDGRLALLLGFLSDDFWIVTDWTRNPSPLRKLRDAIHRHETAYVTGWTGIAALGRNGVVYFIGEIYPSELGRTYDRILWAFDPIADRVIGRFHPSWPASRTGYLAYRDHRHELLAATSDRVFRIDPDTGEEIDSYPRPAPGASLRLVGDRLVTFRDRWLGVHDVDTGALVREIEIENPTDALDSLHGSSIVFARSEIAPDETIVTPIDIESMVQLGSYSVDGPGTSLWIVKVPTDWTPPPTSTPRPVSTPTATRTRTPSATYTASATPTATPTPCNPMDVELEVVPAVARPGEKIEVRIRVRDTESCTSLLQMRIDGDPELILNTVVRGWRTCRVLSPDQTYVSGEARDCDGTRCASIATMVTGPLSTSVRHQIDRIPSDLTIACAAIVGRDAVRGSFQIRAAVRQASSQFAPWTEASHATRIDIVGEAATLTPTPSATPTRTATPTGAPERAPTPCVKGCPAIRLFPVRAAQGGVAYLEARLSTAGREIVALQNDLELPDGVVGDGRSAWRCRGNPFLRQRARFQRRRCTGDACPSLRALLVSFDADAPAIPDGMVVYTCRISIDENAPIGTGEVVVANAIASDRRGEPIPLAADTVPLTIRLRDR